MVTKGIFQQQTDGFPSVTSAPIILVTDSYAQFTNLMTRLKIEQGALANKFAVSLDGEGNPATFGTTPTPLAGLLFKFRLELSQGLGHWRIPATG
jgi:hypothetical protein